MEHKPCSCGCCRESSLVPHETKAVGLFAGVQLFYLPEAASAAAAGKEDAVLRVYACRRGSLHFKTAVGRAQLIHAGELAVWREPSHRTTASAGFWCGSTSESSPSSRPRVFPARMSRASGCMIFTACARI